MTVQTGMPMPAQIRQIIQTADKAHGSGPDAAPADLPQQPHVLRVEDELRADILQQLPQPHEQHPAEAAAEVDRDHHQHAVLPVHQPDLHEPLHGPVAADIEGSEEDHEQDDADPGKLDRAVFGPVHRGHILSVATGYHREDRLSIIFYRKTINNS